MANISIDNLSAEISKELSMFSEGVVEKIDDSSEKVAKETVKKLKATSPKRKKGDGKYSKSWKRKTEKQLAQPNNHIIYNKQGWKAHLLENGHVKSDGGRVDGVPHIRPVEEEVIKEFTEEVEEAIRNG